MIEGRTEAKAWRPQSGVNGSELLLAWGVLATVLLLASRLLAEPGGTREDCQPSIHETAAALAVAPLDSLPAGTRSETVTEAGCSFERTLVVVDNAPHPGVKLVKVAISNEQGSAEIVLFRSAADPASSGRF